MEFRKDINSLRAIAVIGVVVFHFYSTKVPGGFAGVDVFFVLSGYLMTRILNDKLEISTFTLSKFYKSRLKRILPALIVLCTSLIIIGVIILSPYENLNLNKHIFSSLLFFSNITFWQEAGYFDYSSHQKWLLHTWSLSIELQFYLIYPVAFIILKKHLPLKYFKRFAMLMAMFAFLFSIYASTKWPSASYYLLPTRLWEFLFGAIVFLYPIQTGDKQLRYLEWCGVFLIISSYFVFSSQTLWPGYSALVPVLGTVFILYANRGLSFFSNNFVFYYIGKWSYSIYLWHWPILVGLYHFELAERFLFLGILLSAILGYLSFKYVESIQSKILYYLIPIIIFLSFLLYIFKGSYIYSSNQYQDIINKSIGSPFRKECHLNSYTSPENACEYYEKNVRWATLGDSHVVEIGHALALKLKDQKIGVKHFSFSGCKPTFGENNLYDCSQWYNDAANYILNNKKIQNVVFNHRFTSALFGGDAQHYPKLKKIIPSKNVFDTIQRIDKLLYDFARSKERVYVFLPIPELPKDIKQIVGRKFVEKKNLDNLVGTTTKWYQERNKFIINHFSNTYYPENIIFINPKDAFCDNQNCFAVKDSNPLYFDDDHPSIIGAQLLVDLIFKKKTSL